MTATQAHREAITNAALGMGDLRVCFTRTQLKANRKFLESTGQTFVIECSRRWGKTLYSSAKAFEWALAKPDSIVRYSAPTKNHGRQFVIPAFAFWSKRLPEKYRPVFDATGNTWRWQNGSVCHLGSAQTMEDVEGQVGTSCDGAIADEAGKWRSDLLKHWHKSVILPQFLTTKGRLLVPSTPAISGGHYFAELARTSAIRGSYVMYTIDDCDHVPEEARKDLIREIIAPEALEWEPWMDEAAKTSTHIQRELYCKHMSDPTRMIVPEWQAVAEGSTIELEPPKFRDWYCSADFGFTDLSVLLWAWYDFANARIVVEHELAMHQASGLDVGFAAKALEEANRIVPRLRVADAPAQLLADIINRDRGPGLTFSPALKDDAEAALNQLRMLIQQRRIVIHPRCVTLISHLANGIWNAGRTSFDRVEGFGHWDAIDALKYMVRSVNWKMNPTPVIDPSTDMNHFAAHPSLRRAGTRRVLNGARS